MIGLLVAAGVVVAIPVCWFLLSPGPRLPEQPKPTGSHEETALAAGKLLYETNCLQCHGERGDGIGPAAVFLYPKPRDFRSGKFRLVTTSNRLPSDADLMQVISRGMPGSAMFPFGHLAEGDRQQLVGYVRQLTRQGIEERLRQAAAAAGDDVDPIQLAKDVAQLAQVGEAMKLPADLPTGVESVARGRTLYMAQCATCHGETGKGDGVKEQKDDDGTPTRPRDFTRGIFKGGRDPLQLFARIAIGMPGTPMPASPHLKPEQIGDLVNFTQSLSDSAAQAKVEHRRTTITARRLSASFSPTDFASDDAWRSIPTVPVVVSPLWWRDYAEPDLQIQAAHDGTTVAIRLSWNDPTVNDRTWRTEDFEDMAAVQLFKGQVEPFLGMGSAASALDLWLWRASWQAPVAAATESKLDDYPFDAPGYQELTRNGGGLPDFLTARAAGNLHTNANRDRTASSLTAKGFGSTTFRPKTSQAVSAQGNWANGRWTVVIRRSLAVGPEEGLSLAAGEKCSIAFALWDGAARDRNGQKLVSIWHDLKLE